MSKNIYTKLNLKKKIYDLLENLKHSNSFMNF